MGPATPPRKTERATETSTAKQQNHRLTQEDALLEGCMTQPGESLREARLPTSIGTTWGNLKKSAQN